MRSVVGLVFVVVTVAVLTAGLAGRAACAAASEHRGADAVTVSLTQPGHVQSSVRKHGRAVLFHQSVNARDRGERKYPRPLGRPRVMPTASPRVLHAAVLVAGFGVSSARGWLVKPPCPALCWFTGRLPTQPP
jgi:hypothetical protein